MGLPGSVQPGHCSDPLPLRSDCSSSSCRIYIAVQIRTHCRRNAVQIRTHCRRKEERSASTADSSCDNHYCFDHCSVGSQQVLLSCWGVGSYRKSNKLARKGCELAGPFRSLEGIASAWLGTGEGDDDHKCR